MFYNSDNLVPYSTSKVCFQTQEGDVNSSITLLWVIELTGSAIDDKQ